MNYKKLIRKNILNLKPYSNARNEYKGADGVFLDANENPFGRYNRYPDPLQIDLKNQLAKIKNCRSNQIFIGNGSDEIIDLAFRVFCEPKLDKALTFSPTYGMYEVSASINNVDLIQIPLDQSFQIDLHLLQPHLEDDSLKLILICSPNNPTGNLIDANSIDFILKNFNGIVILDEAYIDFTIENSFLNKLNSYPNLIISQTLSKAWGLAGLRLGLAMMNAELVTYFNHVKPPYNISQVNQEVALQTLRDTTSFKQKIIELNSEKTKLIEELHKLKFVKKIYPSDANFVLVEVCDANQIYEKLIQKQIIVRNRHSILPNCLRITIGTSQENHELINELKSYTNA